MYELYIAVLTVLADVSCPALVETGDIILNTTDTKYGTRLNYSCSFDSEASHLSVCTASGVWDPPLISCSGITHQKAQISLYKQKKNLYAL